MASDDIVKLEFPKNVRSRPGMYVGEMSSPDVILREAIDNSIDELYAFERRGNAKSDTIWIEMVNGQHYLVADNGRGIPIKESSEKGITMARLAMSTLNAGSKFNKKGLAVGMNGCFAYDTEVMVTKDLKHWYPEKIGKLADDNEPFYIMTSEGPQRVLLCAETKKVNQTMTLVFDNGLEVECTEDHRFLTKEGIYKEAKDLTESDELEASPLKFTLKDVFDGKVEVYDSLVYRIYNLINGKSYIGTSTKSLRRRFAGPFFKGSSHKERYETSNSELYSDMRKFGIENFEVQILFNSREIGDKIYDLETYYIETLDTHNNGYNHKIHQQKVLSESKMSKLGHIGFKKAYDLQLGRFSDEAKARSKIAKREAGTYRSELQSIKGKKGGKVTADKDRELKRNFFDSERQRKNALKSAASLFCRKYVKETHSEEGFLTENHFNDYANKRGKSFTFSECEAKLNLWRERLCM